MRRGPEVERRRLRSLDAAIEALSSQAESVKAEGGLAKISAFRTYEPDELVAARIEISTGRMLRRREAGVDVMGDGSLVPYVGGIFKRRLDPARSEDPYEVVREALRG